MSTIAAPPVSGTVSVVVGFTARAMPAYHPVRDGYRKGAEQVVVSFRLDTDGLDFVTPTEIGDAVFDATFQPDADSEHSVTARVHDALRGHTITRPLAVGDTLTIIANHGYFEAIEVTEVGWKPIDVDCYPVPVSR